MKLIFTGPDPNSPHIDHPGGQLTATKGFAEFAQERGIAIEWIDTMQSNFPVPPLRTRLRRGAARLWRFAQLAKRGNVDGAILFAGAGIGFVERSFMAAIAKFRGVPHLLMIRDGNFVLHYRRSPLARPIVRALLRVPDKIGVQGEGWRAFLAEAGVAAQRVVVVPNWLPSPPRGTPRAPSVDRSLALLFVGWMTAGKGVIELCEAMRLVAARNLFVKLTMVGGGDLLDECREAAGAPDLAGRVDVRGWLPKNEVLEALSQADVLVLPSHAEGFPNVVMEAMAAGLPVIATPVGAIPDSVTHGVNGLLVPVGDAGALADAIESYAKDRRRVEDHGRSAVQAARELHDRDTNCRRLLEALVLDGDDLAAAAH